MQAAAIKHVDYYFDYLSPYAYFAWFAVREICHARGLELRLQPILLAGLLNHWGQLGPAEIPPKRAFMWKDVYRYAKLHGIEFQGPKSHPFNPLTALRVSLFEVAGADQTRVVDALWRASWGRGLELGRDEEIVSILNDAGLSGNTLLAKTKEPDIKAALRTATDRAVERGVFGVPTMMAGDELFFGNDRFEYLELFLDGRDPLDADWLTQVLGRAKTVERRRPAAK